MTSIFCQYLLLSYKCYSFVYMYIVTGFFVLTYCDLYRQAIPSSNIDNYNLVDALESRILSFTASGYR
jgi:hypothetical protein